MAEKSYFFDSTADDQRIYQAADFARFHAQIIGNGVSNTPNLPDLEVTAKTNMDIALGAGYMFANGYMYENDSTMTLTHAIADPTNDRIDRVVIKFDNNPAQRKTYAYIKKGTPDINPVPPSLQRDNYVYELSVAQVRIIAGKSFVEQSEITDERTNDEVCGYIPLHNIYRGLQINQDGIAVMPNQSYVDVKDDVGGYDLVNNSSKPIPFGTINVDKGGEIHGDTFIPKADGVYTLWLLARSDEFLSPEKIGVDVQFHLVKNGNRYSYPFLAHVTSTGHDNIWVGSCIEQLNAGDSISLAGQTFSSGDSIRIGNTWLRIAKIS